MDMDIKKILELLPHRYPFLLIDRVTDYKAGEYLDGYKNITFNEPFFQGHFPIKPVMPGVLIVEALAQATGLLGFRTMSEEPSNDLLYMLAGVDNVRFKRQVIPGDQLLLKVSLVKRTRIIWKFKCEATVEGELVTAADMLCAATPRDKG